MSEIRKLQSDLPEFDDPRVQIVYEMLCDDKLNTPPNPEEHWEGWLARNIVAALHSYYLTTPRRE